MSTRATGRHRGTSGRGRRHRSTPAFELSESKLRSPIARGGIVPRTALVDRMDRADAPPVVAVVAPAGYGKTTLLAQWAEHRHPRVGWVSVDDRATTPPCS
jgi:LuxR family transcriptional regulator, maltose regulon positive regulatory protein